MYLRALELKSQKGIFTFPLVVVAAPVLEELIIRGITLDGLYKRYPVSSSMIISGVLLA